VVVLTDAYGASEELEERLQDHVKQALALYKYPRDIEFADELPRTSTGKVQREKLPDWPPDSSDTA
jgi:acyl-coenzyme A synthetase/AMP-(fatty) acid ligase